MAPSMVEMAVALSTDDAVLKMLLITSQTALVHAIQARKGAQKEVNEYA